MRPQGMRLKEASVQLPSSLTVACQWRGIWRSRSMPVNSGLRSSTVTPNVINNPPIRKYAVKAVQCRMRNLVIDIIASPPVARSVWRLASLVCPPLFAGCNEQLLL